MNPLEAFAYTLLISVVGYLVIKLAKNIIISCVIFGLIVLSGTLLFVVITPSINSTVAPFGIEKDGRIFVYSDNQKYLIVPSKISSVKVTTAGVMSVNIEVTAGEYIFNTSMNKYLYILLVKSKLFRSIGTKTYDTAT